MEADALDRQDSQVSFPGPFSRHNVVVSGWQVPFLHAQVHDGGTMTLVLDDRLGIELTVAEAERVVPFLADAISVALGYEAHPSADEIAPLQRTASPKPRRVLSVAGLGLDAAL